MKRHLQYVVALAAVVATFTLLRSDERKTAELIFHASFDKYHAHADEARGDGQSTLTESLELRSTPGVSKSGLLIDEGETCRYKVRDNFDVNAATVSFWVCPVNWDAGDMRFQHFFIAATRDRQAPFRVMIGTPGPYMGGKGIRLFFEWGTSKDPGHRTFSVSASVDWKKGEWHKIDAAWDATEMRIFVDGELGQKAALPNVVFPDLGGDFFELVPIWRGVETKTHSPKDRSILDEVKIFDGILSEDRVAANFAADRAQLVGGIPAPRAAIPLLKDAPKIDGVLDEDLWRRASAFPIRSKTGGFAHDHESICRIAYTTDGLMLGLESAAVGPRLKTDAAERDGKLWEDDSFEIFLKLPDMKNEIEFVQFIVNSRGVLFDQKNRDVRWNAAVEVQASSSGKKWFVEMFVPFKSLAVATPRPGTVWLANFCRNWIQPAPAKPIFTSWTECFGSYYASLGEIVFTGMETGYRSSFGSDLGAGILDLRFENSARLPIKGVLEVSGQNRKPLVRSFEVAAGSQIAQKEDLSDFKEAVVKFSAATPDGTAVFSYGTRIYVKKPVEVEYIPYVPEKKLVLVVDFTNLDEKRRQAIVDGAAKLRAAIHGPDTSANSEAVFSVAQLRDKYTLDIVWLDGRYDFKYAFLTEGLETLHTEGVLVKPPTPWLDVRAAVADQVLAPWTPLEYASDGTVSCWGRTYAFDGPFPATMLNRGRDVLDGPMRMTIETDKNRSALANLSGEIGASRPDRMERGGKSEFPGTDVSATWSSWMEYDGLVVTDLKISPPPGGLSVRSLTLEIPLRPEIVKYIRKPKRIEWNGTTWESSFEPYLWIGTEDEGLGVFFDSSANWLFEPEDKPVVVVKNDGRAALVYKMIMRPGHTDKPLEYRLGFQATPVRPMMKGWRAFNPTTRPYRHRNADIWAPHYSTLIGLFNVGDRLAHDRQAAEDVRLGIRTFYYGGALATPDSNPTFEFFRHLWANPYGPSFYNMAPRPTSGNRPYNVLPVCHASSYTDMMAYYAVKLVGEGKASSIYTDMDRLVPCENGLHGCGFTDAFGRTGGTFHILARRDFYKRLLTACRNSTDGLLPGMRMSHCHDYVVLPYHSFNDMFHPGEQFSHLVGRNDWFYTDELDPVAWRVELSGKASGINHVFLPNFVRGSGRQTDYDRPELAESLFAMTVINDVWPAGSYLNREATEEFWDIKKRTGLELDETVSFPYWRDDCPAGTAVRKTHAAVYVTPRSVLIAIANRNPAPTDVEVTLDLEALAIDAREIVALDERTKENVPITGGKFSVPVKARSYTIVSIPKR